MDQISSHTVLIVDDDGINRKILGRIFSDYYAVQEAKDGREGLETILADSSRFCAVLLDHQMPEMTGLEVLQELKKRWLLEEVPVFLITAECSEAVMREAYGLGVMDVISKPVVPFVVLRRVQSVIELFEARKNLGGVVDLQSLQMMEQAEKIIELNNGMIEALATAIEFRNEESGGHVQRISAITKILLTDTIFGEGLDDMEVETIALASVMHDIGKIAIPDAVLTKPGKLTDEEYAIMKTHTIKGAELLESIPQLRDNGIYNYAWDIARHHHERWDGRGYPDGLMGDETSSWSQVVALADVYDALTCKRVYKGAFPREQVIEMICTGQCGLFNPLLLQSFLSVEDKMHALYENLEEAQGG